MNINDDVIREWFYRLPKGYAEAPYSESELFVLADVIAEHDSNVGKPIPEAVELVTEDDEDGEAVPDEVVTKLVNLFKNDNILQKYKKYLSIFHIFDPSSLGTISEVLLARLINKYSPPGIEANVEGGTANLTDITVSIAGEPIDISLKTTAAESAINLGSEKKLTSIAMQAEVGAWIRSLPAEELSTYPPGGEITPQHKDDDGNLIPLSTNKSNDSVKLNKSIGEIKNVESPPPVEILANIDNHIKALINKLAGPEGKPELFVWAAKYYSGTPKSLSGIKLHIIKFDRDKLEAFFNNSYLYATKSNAVGMLDANNKQLVKAFASGKELNVHQDFITRFKSQTYIEDLQLPDFTPIKINGQELGKKQLVSTKMFDALDAMWDELTKG